MFSFYFPLCLFLYLHFLYDNIEHSWFNLGLSVKVLNYQHSFVPVAGQKSVILQPGSPGLMIMGLPKLLHVHSLFLKPYTLRTVWFSSLPSSFNHLSKFVLESLDVCFEQARSQVQPFWFSFPRKTTAPSTIYIYAFSLFSRILEIRVLF